MRRALTVIGLTVVLLLGLVVWRADDLGVGDLVDDLTGASDPPPASEGPAAVPPPPGLELPRLPDAQPVARDRLERAVDPRAVRQSLGRLTRDKRLGPRVAVAVAGLDGRTAYEEGPRVVTPASLLKTATSLAALELLGPQQRFTTSVVRRGGVLTLVGGGDPLLTGAPDPDAVPREADLTTLARQTAQALRQQRRSPARVTVRYDDSLFSGPAVSPAWEDDYVPDDVVSPITALWVDEGREFPGAFTRSADPSRAAALRFAEALRATGTKVAGAPRPGAAPDVAPVASVASAPLVEIVQHVLETSDNEAAEVLLRHAGLAANGPGERGGSFAAGARAVSTTLGEVGVPLRGARILDGSGLARGNRMALSSLLDVLATSLEPKRPTLAGVTGGLPVAGFSGSLAGRFEVASEDGLGWVRAKTGTLTGVHGLAGTVTGRDGTPMLFVAVVDRVKVRNALQARARLDQIASALADCRCAAP